MTVSLLSWSAGKASKWQWLVDGETLQVCWAAAEWGYQSPQQHGGTLISGPSTSVQ